MADPLLTLQELSDELGSPGIGPLWLAVKRKGVNVSKKQVEAFVKQKGEKQIFQAVQPAKGKTVSESLNARWMMDLIVFYKQPVVVGGVTMRYILVCINVFDRYLYAELIKSKESKDVAVALGNIFRRAAKLPKLISSDQGTEFQNEVPELLRRNSIAHKLKAVGDVNGIGVIDKAIQSLKQKIAQMVSSAGTWASVLTRAVAAANKTPKSGVLHGVAPKEVRDDPAVHFMLLQDQAKNMKHNKAVGERRTTALAQTDTFRAPVPGSTGKFKRSYQATYGEPLKVADVTAGTVLDTTGGRHALKSIKVIPVNSSSAGQRLGPNETLPNKKRHLGSTIIAALEDVLDDVEGDAKRLSIARAAYLVKIQMRLNNEDYAAILKKTTSSLIELIRLFPDHFELQPLEDGTKPWYYVSLIQ
jgi:transposase InsO family protein